jgi:uncharacterized protein YdeI (YjbR/CyaY-like superfamily)
MREFNNIQNKYMLYATSREEWRRWLAKHHRTEREIWLVLYKKASGKQSLSPNDALEEASYGWIDSRTKSIDKERFMIRFTPRRKGSEWSNYNKALALKMLREGKMTQAGIEVLPPAVLKRGKF